MSKKKTSKKADKPEAPEVTSGEGEEVESEPAHVEEATIRVRGTGVGGTRLMTPSEHEAYCKENRKKK
ncbi:MAG: hypothetical protein ACYTFQ_26000 [Planctomycetota bacterium]|jgi:hypothetical protein